MSPALPLCSDPGGPMRVGRDGGDGRDRCAIGARSVRDWRAIGARLARDRHRVAGAAVARAAGGRGELPNSAQAPKGR